MSMKEEIFESSSSSTATTNNKNYSNSSINSNSNSNSNTFISKNITVDSNLSVMASLEIFNNRIYFNDDNNRNDSMTNNDTNITMINENPNIKYRNLKKELESLDNDLKELLSTSSKPDDANLWAMLQAETTRLRDRAEGIASHKGFQVYEKATLSSLEKIEEASKKITSSSSSSSTTTTTSSPSIKEPSISLSSLDQRMFTIETMLGYSSSVLESSTSLSSPAPGVDMTINGRGLAIPLIDTIAKIENKLKLITSQSSSQESLIKKCEALKIELDSVNSIISTSSSSSSSSSAAATNLFNVAKSVDDLYEKAQIIEGISPDLPKILNRLQYLEQLSSLSSSFDKRVDTMKGEIDNIRTLLNTNNESITIMKTSLSEQMLALADACKKLKVK